MQRQGVPADAKALGQAPQCCVVGLKGGRCGWPGWSRRHGGRPWVPLSPARPFYKLWLVPPSSFLGEARFIMGTGAQKQLEPRAHRGRGVWRAQSPGLSGQPLPGAGSPLRGRQGGGGALPFHRTGAGRGVGGRASGSSAAHRAGPLHEGCLPPSCGPPAPACGGGSSWVGTGVASPPGCGPGLSPARLWAHPPEGQACRD